MERGRDLRSKNKFRRRKALHRDASIFFSFSFFLIRRALHCDLRVSAPRACVLECRTIINLSIVVSHAKCFVASIFISNTCEFFLYTHAYTCRERRTHSEPALWKTFDRADCPIVHDTVARRDRTLRSYGILQLRYISRAIAAPTILIVVFYCVTCSAVYTPVT